MSEINVLYPFDNNYAPYAGISMTSLLENNRKADSIHIYILGFDISEGNIDALRSTADRYGRDITFIDPSSIDEYIQSFDMPSYRGARIAVARLFITRFIPDDVKRLLYLDSDTLITGDLRELMSCDLCGMSAGMVCDSVARDYKLLMGFTDNDDYYNGGVILYDLDEWKKRNCSERIENHIRNVRNNYEALDQDLINIVLKGEIHKLDIKYNLQPFHLVYPVKTYLNVYGDSGYYGAGAIDRASKDAVILHAFRYLGVFPWHKNTLHPCADVFNQYKTISEWKDIPPAEEGCQPLSIKLERIACAILPKQLFLRVFRAVFKSSMKRIEYQIRSGNKYRNI